MSTFCPDVRNLGGENIVTSHFTKHYASLFNAKPVVNSRAPVAKSGAKKRKPNEGLAENLIAFKKVETAESNTDHKKPETFEMSNKLSEYKKRKKAVAQNSHSSNLQHMQKRIDRYSNKVEQKKNEFNYKENPVVLFRNTSDPNVKSIKKRDKNQDVLAIIKKREKGLKKQSKVGLKELMLTEIIQNGVWTNDDLEAMFEKTRENQKYDKEEIEEAIEYIKSTILE